MKTQTVPHAQNQLPRLSHTQSQYLSTGLLLTLALLTAVGPLGIDLYLPAFPAIVSDLGTDATGVQLTLTSFLLGVALGQLAFGAMSDRLGRKGPLLVGGILLVIASAITVFAPTLTVLILARFLQGFAGAAGMVLGRAIITDVAIGAAAAKAMGIMMVIGGVAPVVAPMIGGLFADFVGWRGLLGILLGFAILMLVAIVFGVKETLPAQKRAEQIAAKATHGSPLKALASRKYVGYTLAFALSFTAMMGYISASPFLYQSMMGMNEFQYGIIFGATALSVTIVSGIAAKLVDKTSPDKLVALGLAIFGVSAVTLLAFVLTGLNPWFMAGAIFILVSSLGLIFGNATALALQAVPGAAGTASALLGALQFILAGAVSPVVNIAGDQSAVPLAVVMMVCAVLATIAFVMARSASKKDDESEPADEGHQYGELIRF